VNNSNNSHSSSFQFQFFVIVAYLTQKFQYITNTNTNIRDNNLTRITHRKCIFHPSTSIHTKKLIYIAASKKFLESDHFLSEYNVGYFGVRSW
jgi:hypothetical protein